MKLNTEQIRHLDTLCDNHGGILRAEDVVEDAKSKDSPLHECFEWDKKKAAEKHWLDQARSILRVRVKFLDPQHPERKVRVFVSMATDRETGGGYRKLHAVLSQPDTREFLLKQALAELNAWQKRYQHLSELAHIFEVLETSKPEVVSA